MKSIVWYSAIIFLCLPAAFMFSIAVGIFLDERSWDRAYEDRITLIALLVTWATLALGVLRSDTWRLAIGRSSLAFSVVSILCPLVAFLVWTPGWGVLVAMVCVPLGVVGLVIAMVIWPVRKPPWGY